MTDWNANSVEKADDQVLLENNKYLHKFSINSIM